MEAFKDPLTFDRLYLKLGIFICDRNSNTCEKNRARTNLLKQDEKLGRFTSSLYICHNKAMTALEYGTR